MTRAVCLDSVACSQDAAGLLEKSELAQKVKEIAAQGPQGEASTTIPEGYIKDDASGDFSFACSAYKQWHDKLHSVCCVLWLVAKLAEV